MRFNPKARINTGRTSDAGRGGGRGGGGGGLGSSGGIGIPIPSGIGKGGIGGVIVIVLFLVLTQCLGSGSDGSSATGGSSTGTSYDSDRYAGCKTGEDANDNPDCARAIVENSLESYWTQVFAQQEPGVTFEPTQVVTFTDSISTGGCGQASADVGPFYCSADNTIYLDTTFFQQVLEGQLGGKGGDFVEPYVIAHEFGHHVQDLLGIMGQVRTQEGPESDSVRLELQADCFAGMWSHGATETTDDSGVKIFDSLDQADISEALDSAKAVGDDLIQKRSGNKVDPESWTHGSSAERQKWFMTGYGATSVKDCDTFSASDLG